MSQQRKKWAVAVAVSAAVATAFTQPAGAGLPGAVDVAVGQPASGPTETFIYAVETRGPADAEKLADSFDLIEGREGNTLFVAGDADAGRRLASAGFRAEVSETLRPAWANPGGLIGQAKPDPARVADTFYGGYHTAMGHKNHVESVAKAKPELAKLHNIGKSHTGKYDLQVLCITKQTAGDCEQRTDAKKPRFFLMTQTHAREIAAGEMSYKFIDHLTGGYGADAEVTALLDSTEIWVLSTHNPDGLDIVAQGSRPSMQRKNRNPAGGNCSGDQVGVDLNRNNSSNWGGASTSKNPCSDVYLGQRADSEVENQALHNVWQKIFKKQRQGGSSPAPADATGYMLSIHTVAGMNLIPWQYANTPTPNDRPLKAIGAQMKTYNGYRTGQAPQILYAASGGHDDWVYDKLGVASATIELGGGGSCGGSNFHPPYSCVDTYWKANSPVLMYLGKMASAPYKSSLGPNVRQAEVAGDTLTAQIDARTYELANVGRERAGGDLTVAEYSFDASFADARPLALRLRAGTPVVTATATVETAGRAAGRHLVYVRAKDKAGHYGPTTAAWVTLG